MSMTKFIDILRKPGNLVLLKRVLVTVSALIIALIIASLQSCGLQVFPKKSVSQFYYSPGNPVSAPDTLVIMFSGLKTTTALPYYMMANRELFPDIIGKNCFPILKSSDFVKNTIAMKKRESLSTFLDMATRMNKPFGQVSCLDQTHLNSIELSNYQRNLKHLTQYYE